MIVKKPPNNKNAVLDFIATLPSPSCKNESTFLLDTSPERKGLYQQILEALPDDESIQGNDGRTLLAVVFFSPVNVYGKATQRDMMMLTDAAGHNCITDLQSCIDSRFNGLNLILEWQSNDERSTKVAGREIMIIRGGPVSGPSGKQSSSSSQHQQQSQRPTHSKNQLHVTTHSYKWCSIRSNYSESRIWLASYVFRGCRTLSFSTICVNNF